jgi:hypothetical protein
MHAMQLTSRPSDRLLAELLAMLYTHANRSHAHSPLVSHLGSLISNLMKVLRYPLSGRSPEYFLLLRIDKQLQP